MIKYNPHLDAVMGVELCPPFLSSSILGGGDTDPPVTPSLRLSLSHEALAALHFIPIQRPSDGRREREKSAASSSGSACWAPRSERAG